MTIKLIDKVEKSIFISTTKADSHWMKHLTKWAKKGQLGEDLFLTHEAASPMSYEEAKRLLEPYVRHATLSFILSGENSHNEEWNQALLDLADETHSRLCIMRIPLTKDPVPEQLIHLEEVAFNPNAIQKQFRDLRNFSYLRGM